MPHSRAILIALIAAAIGFATGLYININSQPDAKKMFNHANIQWSECRDENLHLSMQIDVLEQMVETQQAELDEINAVIGEPEAVRQQ